MRILAVGLHTDTDPVTDRETTSSMFLDTATGEIQDTQYIANAVVTGEGGYLCGCHLFTLVGKLHEMLSGFPGWTIQVNAKERRLVRGSGRLAIGVFLPIYFGFVEPRESRKSAAGGRNRTNYRTNRYHRLFYCVDLAELVNLRSVTVPESVKYAESIVQLCEERGIRFNANKGGLASRLLKASPLWQTGRKAAPEFVNEAAREHLPGNFYGLGTKLLQNHRSAIYVDQTSAHHSVAATVPLPHPDHLRARGHFRKLDHPWLTEPAQIDWLFRQHGLVAAMCWVRTIPNHRKHLYPPFLHESGRRLLFFHTNEREYFDSDVAGIEYVVAAWTSPVPDPALPEYARWAMRARNGGPGRKAILLAAYGSLAQRIDRPVTVYLPWRGKGMKTILPGAGPMCEITRVRKPGQPQPTHVNVLARGIIEAETRLRSLRLAREMDRRGISVLNVYVDGLILETDTLPFLPEGWQVESHLTNVRWKHPNTWIADEMRKTPGVPQDNTPGDQARRMLLAAPVATEEGNWYRRDKQERESARALGRNRWRERQGVLPV